MNTKFPWHGRWARAWPVLVSTMAGPISWAADPPSRPAPPKIAAATSGDSAREIAEAVEWMRGRIDTLMAFPSEWVLPEALRRDAQAVVDEARPRMQDAIRAWATELHPLVAARTKRSASERVAALAWALNNRLTNEFALNHLDSAGPDHDAWREKVATTPGWCRQIWQPPRWGELLFEIERLPESQRAAALEHERQVLARWGQPRPAVPDRPAFSLDAYAMQLVARVKDGGSDKRPPVAMPPVVAFNLLADDPAPLAGTDAREPPHRAVRCAALQWALANARAERAAEPTVLADAFRYARVFRIEDTPRERDADSAAAKQLLAQGWPLHVARSEVTGRVQVRLTRDTTGRVREAQVVSRQLTAPGVERGRPVAFETALDEASLAKARALAGSGPGTMTVEFVWKLAE